MFCGFLSAVTYAIGLKKPTCDRLFFDCVKDPDSCGKPKLRPQLGCDVCGVWTPHRTCSECVTWAEVQIFHYEKITMSCDLAMLEHKRLVDSAGW